MLLKIIIARICDADWNPEYRKALEVITVGNVIDYYEKGVKPYERDHSVWNAYVNGASC